MNWEYFPDKLLAHRLRLRGSSSSTLIAQYHHGRIGDAPRRARPPLQALPPIAPIVRMFRFHTNAIWTATEDGYPPHASRRWWPRRREFVYENNAGSLQDEVQGRLYTTVLVLEHLDLEHKQSVGVEFWEGEVLADDGKMERGSRMPLSTRAPRGDAPRAVSGNLRLPLSLRGHALQCVKKCARTEADYVDAECIPARDAERRRSARDVPQVQADAGCEWRCESRD
ncbi:hypothetical protein B0H19DRAFT_1374946 [Mycena capillaripes]|nr:hypothetical protein B0H19DRAFT_1374946 [Mycena capillaripes]